MLDKKLLFKGQNILYGALTLDGSNTALLEQSGRLRRHDLSNLLNDSVFWYHKAKSAALANFRLYL